MDASTNAKILSAASPADSGAPTPKGSGTLAAGGVGIATGTVVMFLLSTVFGVNGDVASLKTAVADERDARRTMSARIDRLERHLSDQLAELKDMLGRAIARKD